ncbi:MAG: prepilin-type N-terminal cleavage/methylation domain-containing protein [Candidatus Competibacteraceae bacterium]|jgi:general secretion pathway protein I|nr:prepilin-type N-terminal cleavage/methylation domain-containing protein [Candidatus Competibacteraceae bacterium]
MQRLASCRGFSLLEVLVAFAILSLTLGVLLQVFATGLRNTANAEDYTRAVLQAESLLAQVGINLPVESQQGEIDDRFQWRITVTPFPLENILDPETPTENLRFTPYQVVVEVSWSATTARTRSVTLETLRLLPVEL